MAKPLIVLIDDDRGWIETVASLLRDEGCHVRAAADSRQGVDLIARLLPSLVVLDLKPHVSGLEILRELRRRQLRMPVLVVSADSDPSAMPNALAAGATRVLPKPVSAEMLRWTVRLLIHPEVRRKFRTNRQRRRIVA
jgi:DNA-binding response OmpR family regulator